MKCIVSRAGEVSNAEELWCFPSFSSSSSSLSKSFSSSFFSSCSSSFSSFCSSSFACSFSHLSSFYSLSIYLISRSRYPAISSRRSNPKCRQGVKKRSRWPGFGFRSRVIHLGDIRQTLPNCVCLDNLSTLASIRGL